MSPYFVHRLLQHTPAQALQLANHLRMSEPFWKEFVDFFVEYRATREHFGKFRMHPDPVPMLNLDRLVLWQPSEARIPRFVGLARALRIAWDGRTESLPQGWSGSVQRAFEQTLRGERPNTLVPITILVHPDFRKQGWSRVLIEELKEHARRCGFQQLVIPLQETARGISPERAAMSMADYVQLRNGKGGCVDYWFQRHLDMGASALGVCDQSHAYAIPLTEMAKQWNIPDTSGSHVLALSKPDTSWWGWQNFRRWHIDHQIGLGSSYTGCLWVSHPLESPSPQAAPPLAVS